jgi:4-amino-4-deoxy-L-arabinose transferase-like glycosyltransferase
VHRVPRALLLVIGAGVAMRLALIAAGGPPQRFEYDDIARSLIAGRGYVYDQLGTPYRSFYAGLGYMAINIVTDWLFPASARAMLVVQSLCAGILALIVFRIARRFCDEPFAVAAAALTLCHPALVYYDTRKLHPLGFDSLMMMSAVWLLLRVREDGRLSIAVASGAVLALALLQRGSMALFLAGAVVWLAVCRSSGRLIAAYVAGALIVITPWAARNYAIHGTLMLESMTTQQFWKGNATYSNGSGYLAGGRNVYDAAPERLVREWQQRDEVGQFQLFREEGIAEVRKDPGRGALLVVKKFIYFWTVPPNSGQDYPPRYFAAYLAYYAVVVIAAALGLAAIWQRPTMKPGVVLIVIYFASVSIVHALMFVYMRHRWAAEPMMLAFVPVGARTILTHVMSAYRTVRGVRL